MSNKCGDCDNSKGEKTCTMCFKCWQCRQIFCPLCWNCNTVGCSDYKECIYKKNSRGSGKDT